MCPLDEQARSPTFPHLEACPASEPKGTEVCAVALNCQYDRSSDLLLDCSCDVDGTFTCVEVFNLDDFSTPILIVQTRVSLTECPAAKPDFSDPYMIYECNADLFCSFGAEACVCNEKETMNQSGCATAVP